MTQTQPPLTVAIIGLGRAGWNLHLKPLLPITEFKIVAVADPSPERCREAVQVTGCQTFSSIDALLAESDAKLVVVATPSASHAEDVRKVLEAGRHCIAEKPLALDIEDAESLVQLANEKKLHLFVHHVHLFREDHHCLKEIIASGKLGRIFNIRGFWANYSRRWDWQTLRKNGGGLMLNWGPHILSIVLPLLGGKVTRVVCDMRHIKDAGDADDHVEMFLKTENGVTSNLVISSACAQPAVKWMVLGSLGTLASDGKTCELKYYDSAAVPKLEVLDTAAPDRQYNSETLPWKIETIPMKAPFPVPAFHQHIRDVFFHDAESLCPPEGVLEVMRVIEAARRDAESSQAAEKLFMESHA